MKACRLPLLRVKDKSPICTVNSGTSLTFSATVRFRVKGFHPLLRVVVLVYFERKTGSNSSASTWSGAAITNDDRGQQVNLQNIFTNQNLEDAREFDSAAEALEFTCAIGSMATSTVSGTWMAKLLAAPAFPMDPDLFCELLDRLVLDTDKVTPVISATSS